MKKSVKTVVVITLGAFGLKLLSGFTLGTVIGIVLIISAFELSDYWFIERHLGRNHD